jgi:hypothetical protein
LTPQSFEYNSITRLPRLLNSPNLSSADFWLFDRIKATPEGYFFQDINKGNERIVQILRPIPLGTFLWVSNKWKERLAECISGDRKYLQLPQGKSANVCLSKKSIKSIRLSAPLQCH